MMHGFILSKGHGFNLSLSHADLWGSGFVQSNMQSVYTDVYNLMFDFFLNGGRWKQIVVWAEHAPLPVFLAPLFRIPMMSAVLCPVDFPCRPQEAIEAFDITAETYPT